MTQEGRSGGGVREDVGETGGWEDYRVVGGGLSGWFFPLVRDPLGLYSITLCVLGFRFE